MYGGGGDYQGQGAFKKVKDGDLMAMGLLSAFGMGMLPGAMGGGVGGGAVGGVGSAAGDAFLPGALASTGGATVPFGSVIPGLEAWALPATAGGAAGGAAFNAAADSQLANAAITAGGGDALAGYGAAGLGGVTGSPVGGGLLGSLGGGAASALSSLAGNSSVLGLGATALGGLLGAKGQQGEQTSQNKIDPRLDPYIYGDQGILKQVNDLKNQQLAQGGLNDLQRQGMGMTQNFLLDPALSAGYTSMRNMGSGLLGRGVAGNPFAK
jgi:hypothetical protein